MVKKIDTKSIQSAQTSFKRLKLDERHVKPVLDETFKMSRSKAATLSKAIIQRSTTPQKKHKEIIALMHWGHGTARVQKDKRRTLCRSFKQSGMNIALIHGISELKKQDARAYMKDYFAEKGDMKSIVEWLEVAGHVLRKQDMRTNVDKKVVKAVGNAIEDAVDAVGDMVSTVVDAIVSAGKSLVNALREAVNWVAGKVSDLVRALIEAGKSVAHILSEAAKIGLNAVKKFVRAVIDAGRAVFEVVAWTVNKVASVVRSAVRALIEAGKKVAQILGAAISRGFTVIRKIVDAILAAGRAVKEILAYVANKVTSAVRNVVRALLNIGKTVAHILQSAVSLGLSAIRKMINTVIALGRRISEVMVWLGNKAAGIIKEGVRALLQAGKKVAEILAAAAQRGVAILQRLAQGIIAAGRAIREALAWVANKTVAAAAAVVRGILAAGRKIAAIVADAVRLAASALRKVVMAIYQATRKVGEILASVARRAGSIIRTTLEGLLAVGVQLTKAVVSICKDIGKAFRKGFFKGLLEIVKAPLKILKAAAKAGGAVLGLAVAVFMEMWGGHRQLTAAEKVEARRVFGSSIDLNRVKVAVASIPSDIVNWLNGGRPFTTMYIINFASWAKVDKGTLIHELTHVWQGVVSGPVYMVEALHSQAFGRGYNVTDEDLANAKGKLRNLEREQQAVVVERYWGGRWGGQSHDWNKYFPLARQVYKPVRTGIAVRYNPLVPVTGIRIKPKMIRIATDAA
jgi:phage-related protein